MNLGLVILGRHQVSFLGSSRQPLARSALLASGLGFGLLNLVGMDPVEEVLPALAVLHMLHADADPLGQNLAADALIHNDTHGALGHVEDTTRLAVVGLVGHTLLEGSTSLDVDDVSNLVHLEVGGEVLHAGLLEAPGEHVAGPASVSCRVSHPGFSCRSESSNKSLV